MKSVMYNNMAHVLLSCLKTTPTREKFFEELTRKDSNIRNLHDDVSIVRYILNLNTEDISVVICSFCKTLYGLTDAIGCQ